MFTTVLRAGLTLLAGAPVIWLWQQVMDRLIAQLETVATEGSPLVGYLESAGFWFPFIALTMILVWIVGSAVVQRQTVRGGI